VRFERRPTIETRTTDRGGRRRLHVSNGQGLGPQSPSYEAMGFPIALSLAT